MNRGTDRSSIVFSTHPGSALADISSVMHWQRLVERAGTWTLDALAPRGCAACGTLLSAAGALCERCEAECAAPSRRRLPSGLPVLAASSYAGPVPDAIKRLKYGNRADIGIGLGRWAAARLGVTLGPEIVVAPVPLHPRRLASRGYNQASLLARGLAPAVGARSMTCLLARQSDTAPQAELAADARRRNVHRAFRARSAAVERRIWLLDDVVTTGATAEACAEALMAAGADVQGVLCVAIAARDERGDGGVQLI